MDSSNANPTTDRPADHDQKSRRLLGYILIVLGGFFLLPNLRLFELIPWQTIITWWPLILIHFGVEQIAQDRPLLRNLWYVTLVAIIAYILTSNFL